ncbi:Phosphoenolpyruvate phosphomutase [Nymphaea thermarum]|nr:Phosphoenolpyruvate phosphomutase [Nymphaea thermarum]
MAGILSRTAALRSKAGSCPAGLLTRWLSPAAGNAGRSFSSSSSPDSSAERITRIQRIIDDEGVVLLPGCYDALSASIVQKTGFSAGFISGYSVSAARLGKPDIGLMTPPEMAAAARTICASAPDIPFIADADTGGGNSLNVQRTVQDLIAAGAAGCFLEVLFTDLVFSVLKLTSDSHSDWLTDCEFLLLLQDQAWPKKCGHMRGKQVIPAEEHAAKIAAARDAIGDSDFFLIARTDARAISEKYGLSEAISRANLYMEAGADACFVDAPRSDNELREIARQTNGYRVVNMIEGGVTPLHTQEELKEMGFHIILHSTTTLYTAARALTNMLTKMKQSGSSKDHLDMLASFAEFNQLINLESYFAREAHYAEYKNALEARNELKASSGAL